MTTSMFIKKTVIKLIILFITVIVFLGASTIFDTILTNELALTQMENSNELYATQQAYHNIVKPIIATLYTIIIGSIVISVVWDTIKYSKRKFKEN